MNQKHMDSISLGIHMGLRTGGGRIWGTHFGFSPTSRPADGSLRCGDRVPGRVPFSARVLQQPQRRVQGPRPPQGPTMPRRGPSGPWFDVTGLSVPVLHRSVAETRSAPRLGACPPGGHHPCFGTREATLRGVVSEVTQPGGASARPGAQGSALRPRSGSLWSGSCVLTPDFGGGCARPPCAQRLAGPPGGGQGADEARAHWPEKPGSSRAAPWVRE